MSLTVKNCLNRWCWCLRSCNSYSAVAFINRQRVSDAASTDKLPMKGRPPFGLACIAPHCNHWEALTETTGNCLIRSMLKDAANSAVPNKR